VKRYAATGRLKVPKQCVICIKVYARRLCGLAASGQCEKLWHRIRSGREEGRKAKADGREAAGQRLRNG
jgi:hypothetical protein